MNNICNTLIFNSDFFTDSMIKVMSAADLYKYRQITMYLYKNISIEKIIEKIIKCVQNRMKIILNDKYDGFVNLMAKRNIEIYGPWVTQLIYGNIYSEIYMQVRISEDTMGTSPDDNIFSDYKYIDVDTQYDSQERYTMFCGWFLYESDLSLYLNDYENITARKIKLEVFSDKISETHSKVFQNKIYIIDGEWKIKFNNIKKVMHKKEILNLSEKWSYRHNIHSIFQLCQLFDISIVVANLYLYMCLNYSDYQQIIIHNSDNNEFIMHDLLFKSQSENKIKCNPIKLINSRWNFIDIDINIIEKCTLSDCLLNNSEICLEHFHTITILGTNDNKLNMNTRTIVIKYDQNNKIFNRYIALMNNYINYETDCCIDVSLDKYKYIEKLSLSGSAIWDDPSETMNVGTICLDTW